MKKRATCALLLALATVAGPTFAASRTWTGAAGTLYSDPRNWEDGIVPVPGDRAILGPVNGLFISIDIPGVSLDGIDFVGGQVFGIRGSALTLTGTAPITVTSNFLNTVAADITFSASNPTMAIFGTGGFQVGSGFQATFAGGTVTLTGPAAAGFDFESNITELAPTRFKASTSILFGGSNSFSNGVDGRGNVVGTSGVPPLGAASGPVSISSKALLYLYSSPNATVGNSLSLSQTAAAGQPTVLHRSSGAGVVNYTGPVSMATDQVFSIIPPGNVTLSGRVSGAGHLTLTSSGPSASATYHLANPSNSFTGGLEVDHSTLVADANGAIPATGPIVVGAEGLMQIGSTTQAIQSLSCDGGGSLQFNPGIGALKVAGQVTLGNCTLLLAGPTIGSGTLIQSAAPVAGHFTGLPEGANIAGLTLTYHGGTSGNDVVLLTAPLGVTEVQDLWWAGTLENGWGMSLIQHGDRLFAALYIYDASGNPTWVAMLGGSWNPTHTAFAGPLYEPAGTPYYAYDTTHFVVGDPKGTLTITFQDFNNATLDYNIGSLSGHKVITRQTFGSGTMVGADHTDLWWGGLSQNGWGMTIMQQDATLFPIWFTYGTSGAPVWYFMTGAWNAANDTYSGTLYRATSSPWLGAPYDASKFDAISAGTFSIVFGATNATFTYNADGHSGTMPLVRQPF